MEAIPHVLLFYFFARAMNLRYKWIGMVTAVAIDTFGILAWTFTNVVTGTDPTLVTVLVSLNAFSHSLFVISIFLPLIFINKKYFLPAATGALFNIVPDIFVHRSFPNLTYPLRDTILPWFVTSDYDPFLILGYNVILLALLVYFERDALTNFYSSWKEKVKASQRLLLMGMILIIGNGAYYLFVAFQGSYPWLILVALPIASINLFFILLLFIREISRDKKMNRWRKFLLGSTSKKMSRG